MTGPDVNTFTGFDTYLEPRLTASKGRKRHAVLRFFLDYPGRKEGKGEGIPSFLLKENGGSVESIKYTAHGGGVSPDYGN